MKILFFLFICTFRVTILAAQLFVTPYEKSNGTETATYEACISFYKNIAKQYPQITIKTIGTTDAGYPLHVVIYEQKNFKLYQPKVTILINNGIHAGESDGVDASMLFLRDIVTGKMAFPANIKLAIIPFYNIGGALNRGSYSRVNQEGPLAYGFRGNAQNLDLNRDFTKCDSKNAQSFASIFHWLKPHILLDTHVSDGADFQHTMTLLSTQHNKLGEATGTFLHQHLEPALYAAMRQKGWDMIPYVNFEAANPAKGWTAFYDAPRYSTGYAALFGTVGFMTETHMLKPFAQRVKSTYDFIVSLVNETGKHAAELVEAKLQWQKAIAQKQFFPLQYSNNKEQFDTYVFMGYETDTAISNITQLPIIRYNKQKPYSKTIQFYNYLQPTAFVKKPKAYIIPAGWHSVINLLKLNKVELQMLKADTVCTVEAYKIDSFTTTKMPYEKHYKHSNTKVTAYTLQKKFLKGDYLVKMGYETDRFVIEMLEPTGEDSYFAWNYFDAILQQKEGYSNYRWEPIAEAFLNKHPEIRKQLEEKKAADLLFRQSADAQLQYIYQLSPYYEPEHKRYPIYRCF